MLTLKARPLRFDLTQVLIPVAVLPGLALAVVHAPMALLTFGPLVLSSWLLMQRERHRLDHCEVLLSGPALELRYRGQLLCGLDLRYAIRHTTPGGDLVLSEGDASFLAFGADPPESAYPMGDLDKDGEPVAGLWRAVRLTKEDLALLRQALQAVAQQPPPSREEPFTLVQALGSVGRFGQEAEALLAQHLRRTADPGRPDGVLLAVRELALRPDRTGEAARRLLKQI
jgi:hypothetical protein